MDDLQRALADVRAKARELREAFGDEPRARAIEWAAERIEAGIKSDGDRLVSLRQAAGMSGYSAEHLARLVREGKIPDAWPNGHKGRLVCDLDRRFRPR